MLICIEPHRTCGFPGGGGPDPLLGPPPLDPHLVEVLKALVHCNDKFLYTVKPV